MSTEKRYRIVKTSNEAISPMFECQVSKHAPLYSFSMKSIPEEKREWLGEMVSWMLFDAYDAGKMRVRHEAKRCLRGFLETIGYRP